jgi:alpha-pyrone synthase
MASRTLDLMSNAYLNRIATAVPPHDIHGLYLRFAERQLGDTQARTLRRMATKAGIDHRYSYLAPSGEPDGASIDADGFYTTGLFPTTGERMRLFEALAPELACDAVGQLQLGGERNAITHLLITTCTGLSSPGLDLEMLERCRLPRTVERTVIGFMGCYAAINALKLARHIVRSEPKARVLVLNLELCTLHLQETPDLERILSFMLWGDGCAASLVSADPRGLSLDSFRAVLIPESRSLITWAIGDSGFEMELSGQVPRAIQAAVGDGAEEILNGAGADDIDLWAVHPGGRTVLDAVEHALRLAPSALAASREVLRCYGNMSSATVMFVLAALMQFAPLGAAGCAMSFGPGLVAETMLFHAVG